MESILLSLILYAGAAFGFGWFATKAIQLVRAPAFDRASLVWNLGAAAMLLGILCA